MLKPGCVRCRVLAVDNTIEVEYGEDNDSWNKWVDIINTALTPVSLHFGHTRDEYSGILVFAIVRSPVGMPRLSLSFLLLPVLQVNRKGDDAISQMGTEYSPSEIKFFKAVVRPPGFYIFSYINFSQTA